MARGRRLVLLARPASVASLREHWAQQLKDQSQDDSTIRVVPWDSANTDDSSALYSEKTQETPDALISCISSRSGGIDDAWAVDHRANQALLRSAQHSGIRHFTLLSAICVQRPRLAFQHAKLAFEQELRASHLSHSIVRPTAFYKSLSGQIRRVREGKPFFVFGDGELTRCKPIAEEDLAEYLCQTLERPELQGVLPIGGPEPAITPMEQAKLLARCTGKPPRVRKIPAGAPAAIAKLLELPGLVSRRWRDRAEFARIAHYYATESMLLWDEQRQCYDADATPSFGSRTLEDSYRAQLAGLEEQTLGTHSVFDRA
ncbi:MAG: NAD(P)H-binding protein [Pseudomonadota bacterium]